MVVSSPEGTHAAAGARDHRAGPAAAHVGPESSDLTALSAREGSLARAGVAAFIANIVRVPLMEDPGTRYRYSESPTVVGRLIEIWSGEPLDRFLANQIFQPLGMTDTVFWVAPEQAARFTTRYALSQRSAGRERDRRGSVHGPSGPARGRGRVGVYRARFPPLQPDAAEQGRAGWRAAVVLEVGGVDDHERPVRGGDEGAQRHGLGTRQRRSGCRSSAPEDAGESRRVQAGTDRRAPISGTIRRPIRSPS